MLGVFLLSVAGCAGPSKVRLRVLLMEARDSNRECHRVIKQYEVGGRCRAHPEQGFGALEMNLGGMR